MPQNHPANEMVMTALLGTRLEKLEELHQTLASLLKGIREQPGCLDCSVGQDLEGGPRFHIHLVWKDGSSLEAFMASEVFRILLGASNVLAFPAEFRIVAARDTTSPAEWSQKHNATRAHARQPSPP